MIPPRLRRHRRHRDGSVQASACEQTVNNTPRFARRRGGSVRALRFLIGATLIALMVAGCTGQPADTPEAPTASTPTTGATPTVPSPVDTEALKAAAASRAAKAAAVKKSAQVAAQSSEAAVRAAAAKAAAQKAAAAKSAAARASSQQAAAQQSDAERSSAQQSALDASGVNGWTDSAGNWISPDTAARALAHGIAPGGDVPGYLRCGTICGEAPTSGEVQSAWGCLNGTMSCDGIDAESVLFAAGVSDQAIADAKAQRAQSDTAVQASDAAQKACVDKGGYMVIRGTCYMTKEEAVNAGE